MSEIKLPVRYERQGCLILDRNDKEVARTTLANANSTDAHLYGEQIAEAINNSADQDSPADAVLWCPNCFEQHIDEAKPDICEECGLDEDLCTANGGTFRPWLNPSHRSHRCSECNHVWRPADRPTNGVLKLAKQGERDQSAKPIAFANGKDFNDAVEIATQHSDQDKRIAELEAALERYSPSLGNEFFDKCVFAEDLPELCRTHNYDYPCPVYTLQQALARSKQIADGTEGE